MRKDSPEYAQTHEFWNAGHFNENRAAGIAIKTTGNNPRIHELIQICVFPLTSKFELSRETIPFDMDIKPIKKKEDFILDKSGLNKDRFNDIIKNATQTPQMCAELFDSWMEKKIQLRFEKKLLPVTHNWAYIRPFIRNWLGPVTFESYFSHEYRDLMSAALYCNDYSDINNYQILYPKVSMQYITRVLHIEHNRHDESILFVKAICEAYRAMMKLSQFKDFN